MIIIKIIDKGEYQFDVKIDKRRILETDGYGESAEFELITGDKIKINVVIDDDDR